MRFAELEVRIASMSELLDIVGAMRALAGIRALEAQRALPAIRRYAGTMADGIGSALGLLPEPPMVARPSAGRRALVLFTAEHGFVGGFNERLLDAVGSAIDARDRLLVLGSRGAALATERVRSPSWSSAMATRSNGAPEIVRSLAAELSASLGRGEIARVEVIYARHRQGELATVERRVVLPLDPAVLPAPSRDKPLHNLAPAALVEALVQQYVFALLTEAAIESIASENAARFSAMEAAHQNVSKKLDQLQQSARQARQDDITTELLDVVTGAEALRA